MVDLGQFMLILVNFVDFVRLDGRFFRLFRRFARLFHKSNIPELILATIQKALKSGKYDKQALNRLILTCLRKATLLTEEEIITRFGPKMV